MTQQHQHGAPESAPIGGTVPPGIDPTKPSIARVYDALLGGKNNFAADREVAQQMIDAMPGVTEAPRLNRAALARAVRYLAAEVGIEQFIDLGSGLPTQDNVHQVAQRHAPGARVVYVDNDPIVLAHGRALLADERTTIITADIREPERVLSHPDLLRLIDFERPIGLIMCAILHHILDEERPQELVVRFRDRMPPGSHLFITHVVVADEETRAKLEPISIEHLGTGVFRLQREIEAFFTGWELIEPGVVPVPLWYPGKPIAGDPAELTEVERMAVAGMGRK